MAERDDEEWMEVASAGDDEEAQLIAGLLQSEGIPCQVEGPALTPFPEDIGAFGTTRVMVPPEHATEARSLIARRRREYERGGGLGNREEDAE